MNNAKTKKLTSISISLRITLSATSSAASNFYIITKNKISANQWLLTLIYNDYISSIKEKCFQIRQKPIILWNCIIILYCIDKLYWSMTLM